MTRIEPEGADLARLHWDNRDRLPMWTVTRRPTDYPDHIVARLFLTLPDLAVTTVGIIGDTLDEVRAALPPGLFRLVRQPDDEPQIVETWL